MAEQVLHDRRYIRAARIVKGKLGVSVAAALIAGCSNGRSSLSGTSSVTINGLPFVPVMADKENNKKKKPLYQFMSTIGGILAYDYPVNVRPIRQFYGGGGGECANVLYGTAKRDFWVTAPGSQSIEEFEVDGSSPIKTLSTSAGQPVGCAMDPRKDYLAATIVGNGDIVYFPHEKGPGQVGHTQLAAAYYDGYDDQDDLFVDGFNASGAFELVEQAPGSNTPETITTSNTVLVPGAVQWDGKYITVTDQAARAIYRYTVRGTQATLEGTVSLSGSSDCVQTWIGSSGLVFCPDGANNDGEVYKYPAGGSPVATLMIGSADTPIGFVEVRK